MPGTEVHLLGLFIDPAHCGLQQRIAALRASRVTRATRMVEVLAALDAPIDWTRVEAIAGEASVGRPHVARALLEAGHVTTIEEAFERFLAHGRPAYVESDRLTPPEAIALVSEARGLPVFAHPPFTKNHERVAAELAGLGALGMEVYYGRYDDARVADLRALAERLGLFPSGGSDFHAFDRRDECLPGDIPLPPGQTERILALAAEHGCPVPDPTPGEPPA